MNVMTTYMLSFVHDVPTTVSTSLPEDISSIFPKYSKTLTTEFIQFKKAIGLYSNDCKAVPHRKFCICMCSISDLTN